MKKLLSAASVAALAITSSASAINTVFDFSVIVDAQFEYSNTSFDVFDDLSNYDIFSEQYTDRADFLAQNSVFDQTQGNTTVNGFARLSYAILDLAIDPTFDVNEIYDWCIDGFVGLGYTYKFENDVPEFPAPLLIDDTIEVTGSVSDLTQLLFGASPADVAAVILGLPGSGSLNDLIDSLNLATGFGIPTDPFLDNVLYATDFGIPTGSIHAIVTEPIPGGLEYAAGGGIVELSIQAKRQSPVPDAGSTGILALAGFGVLLIARKRFKS